MSGSCSKEFHFQKFIDKGGKIEPEIEWKTVIKTDTIKGKDGRDSIVYQTDSIPYAVYETKYVPKWQIRFDNWRFADSLKHIRRMYADSLKNDVKSKKIEYKTVKVKEKLPWWYSFALIASVVVAFVLFLRVILPR